MSAGDPKKAVVPEIEERVATLFDFNGVLVDDEGVHFEAFREVITTAGVVLTRSLYTERYLGLDDAGAFRAMLLDRDVGAASDATDAAALKLTIAELVEAKRHVYMARIARDLVLFDGAVELVRLRATLGPVGIV